METKLKMLVCISLTKDNLTLLFDNTSNNSCLNMSMQYVVVGIMYIVYCIGYNMFQY